jgi:hypothetical protein
MLIGVGPESIMQLIKSKKKTRLLRKLIFFAGPVVSTHP